MLSERHRHKLVDGLVMIMGKPDSKMPPPSDSKETETQAPAEDDSEGLQCAKDAARALGITDMDDKKADAFATAIREIAGGYSKK